VINIRSHLLSMANDAWKWLHTCILVSFCVFMLVNFFDQEEIEVNKIGVLLWCIDLFLWCKCRNLIKHFFSYFGVKTRFFLPKKLEFWELPLQNDFYIIFSGLFSFFLIHLICDCWNETKQFYIGSGKWILLEKTFDF
jgi:hypothetical protein